MHRGRVALLVVLAGAVLAIAPPALAGHLHDAAWYAAEMAMGLAAFGLSGFGFGRRTLAVVVPLASAAVSLLAILTAVAPGRGRVELAFGNPNLLAASITMLAAGSAVVLRRRSILPFLLALAAVAVVLTGSRTGAVAVLLVGVLVAAAAARDGDRERRDLLIALAAVAALLLAGGGALVTVSPRHNLLAYTADLTRPEWEVDHLDGLQLSRVAAPDGSEAAWRLSGTFEEPSRRVLLVLRQAAGFASPEVDYTASAYVRSPTGEPSEVWLSTNQGDRYPCSVGTDWTRCTGGPDRGTEASPLQFRLWSRAEVDPFVLDVWGLQLERGAAATPVELTGVTAAGRLAHRLTTNARRILYRERVGDRLTVMQTGWRVFLGSPWLGAGRAPLTAALAVPTTGVAAAGPGAPDEAGHAHTHDLLVQLLAEVGVLGAVGALAVFLGPVVLLPRGRLLRFAPALVALVAWNAIDFTAFFAPMFLAYMACLGYATWADRA